MIIMASPREGGPPGEGRNYPPQQYADDQRRYQLDREVSQDQQLSRPNGAFTTDNRLATSPAGSTNGRDKEAEPPKTSGESKRSRSRTRNGRTGSGQLRVCKKCGEPLTGQFVRALGGTFHLECFRCAVCTFSPAPVRGIY